LRWPVVLFDLDGTLANSIDLVVASYTHAFASVTGAPTNAETAKRWIGETLRTTFGREAPGHTDELEEAYRNYYAERLDAIHGYPGMTRLLKSLRDAGAITGVVTAKRRETALVTMRQAGVEGLIDLVGAMEDTSAHKPDPAPLLAAASKLGVEPADCVYIGDAVHDVQAAHAAGMEVIAVTWGAGVTSDLMAADIVCDDAKALTQALFAPG